MCGAARAAAALLVWSVWGSTSGQRNSNAASLGVVSANGVAHRGRLQELHYYEGMPANFTCARTPPGPSSRATVQISYFSKESGAVSTLFRSQDSVEIYFKLTSANNDTLLTCTIKDDSKNDSTIIQMRLLLRTILYKEGFEVNGQLIARRAESRESAGVLRFEYNYIWEEHMTVRLVKDAREYNAAWCTVSGYNFPGPWLDHVNANETLSSSLGVHLVNTSLLQQQSGTKVTCHLQRIASDKLVLEITFIYYDLVPFVGGLSMANVMLLYKDENVTYITYDNDMSYTGNGSHYITCNPDGPATKSMWIFIPPQVVYSDATYPNSFRLKDYVKWTLIKCLRVSDDKSIRERVVHLWLHRRDAPTALTSPLTRPLPTRKSLATLSTELPSNDKDIKIARWVPAVAAVVSLVALVCMLLAVSIALHRPRWCCASGAASGPSGDCTELHAPPSRLSCDSEEHQYEVIPDLPASKVSASIAQRPPQPLPDEAFEESGASEGPYRHYDTPYEWRIFRFGVRRCACGRCSTSG